MAELSASHVWVDKYVRDELTAEEMSKFEEALMIEPRLQQDLETALGMQETLKLEYQQAGDSGRTSAPRAFGSGQWQSLAFAATLVLAVFSTVMYWRVGIEAGRLQDQLAASQQPYGAVLSVPIDIMRSANSQTPDAIIQKPVGHSAVLLDIEIGPAAKQFEQLDFALIDQNQVLIAAWQATSTQGRSSAVLASRQLPIGRVWLTISSPGGEELERRLLEFR